MDTSRKRWLASFSLLIAFVLAANGGYLQGATPQAVNPGFNFEGIEAFWTIATVLESDTEPSEAQWKAFFAAPGYERLADEFGRSYFQNALRAVFMPSQGDLEAEMVRTYAERGGFLGWYTPLVIDGFREASENREWMAGRVRELKTHPYLEEAAGYALEYLPDEAVDAYPAVNFVVFNDSRGYTPLIMGITGDDLAPSDLECLERQGHDRHLPFLLLMAHESFHMYRGQEMEIELPEPGHPDYALLWTLDQMTNEGIGDLIHRKRLYYGDGCMAGTERAAGMHREQLAQPATIRIVDAILSEMAAEPDVAGMLGGQLQSFVPQSGHPTGFFMANLIEEELGTGAIRDVVRNPFEFFKLYNQAALENGEAPVFSPEAMAYLANLQEKHSIVAEGR